MKKLILFLLMAVFTYTANAQIATENAKILDNTYITVGGGVSTPLDNLFPVNPSATIAIGKEFTPVFGAEVEGTAWFGSYSFNHSHFDTPKTHNIVRGQYLGMNGIVNLTNLFCDYQGSPRPFELKAVAGTGWLHTYRPNRSDASENSLGVKTGLDFAFNINDAHTISIRPAMLWDVFTLGEMPLQFDKRQAQFYLGAAYTYHFKTSNGTHSFKTYDVGAMNREINNLKRELRKKPQTVTKEIVKERIVEKNVGNTIYNPFVVTFAQNSAALTEYAKDILDNIPTNVSVDIIGSASPEGTTEYNQALSEKRAAVVADYLTHKGVVITSSKGIGSPNAQSQRIVTVVVK